MSVKNAIESRRAYRSIESFEVTEEIITELADAARLAPSCFNNQPWRFVFVYGRDKFTEMNETLSSGNRWAHNGGMYIIAFSKPDLDCQIKGRDYYQFDTGMSFAFLILRATELGLVVHPMAGYSEEKVKKTLNIPDDMKVIVVAAVGRKIDKMQPELSEEQVQREAVRPERLENKDFIFRDTYKSSG